MVELEKPMFIDMDEIVFLSYYTRRYEDTCKNRETCNIELKHKLCSNIELHGKAATEMYNKYEKHKKRKSVVCVQAL